MALPCNGLWEGPICPGHREGTELASTCFGPGLSPAPVPSWVKFWKEAGLSCSQRGLGAFKRGSLMQACRELLFQAALRSCWPKVTAEFEQTRAGPAPPWIGLCPIYLPRGPGSNPSSFGAWHSLVGGLSRGFSVFLSTLFLVLMSHQPQCNHNVLFTFFEDSLSVDFNIQTDLCEVSKNGELEKIPWDSSKKAKLN